MAGARGLRFIQLGKETTAGTSVAATTIWRGTGSIKTENAVISPKEDVGYFGGADRAYIPKIGAVLQMESVPLTFEQVPYILNAGVKGQAGTQDGTQGSGYVFTHTMPTTAANTTSTYTIEGGDDQQEEEIEYAFVESFKFSGKYGEAWMMDANWRGRQTTKSTKTGSLSIPTVEAALFQKTSLYIDAVSGTIGTTQVSSSLLDAEINVNTGLVARWTADGNLYFSQTVLGMPSVTASLTFLHNSSAVAQKDAWIAGTSKQLQLKCTGTTLTTGGTYTNKTFIANLAGHWTDFDKLGEDNGNDIVKGTFEAKYNATAALFASFIVVNQLSALP